MHGMERACEEGPHLRLGRLFFSSSAFLSSLALSWLWKLFLDPRPDSPLDVCDELGRSLGSSTIGVIWPYVVLGRADAPSLPVKDNRLTSLSGAIEARLWS